MTDEERTQDPFDPVACCTWEDFEGDQQRKCPNLADESDEEALLDLLRQPCPEEQLANEKNVSAGRISKT